MEVVLFISLLIITFLLVIIFQEIEKIVDNTLEIGKYLNRQEKREVKFANNLDKYVKFKKGGKK